MPSAFWWKGRKNFGDLLTPLLLERFADIQVSWSELGSADILCVGSNLDVLPHGWSGIVAGAGKLYPREGTGSKLKDATVLGLRGHLTARDYRYGMITYGDPGLLANELVTVEKEYDLGIVPHWSDTTLEHRFKEWKPRIIRPDQDALTVISEIGRCKKIVSSSLHGIIVADSFSIPRRIEYTPTLDREGGLFKFEDYSSSLGIPLVVGQTQQPDRYRIEDIQHELYDMFERLGEMVNGKT